MMKKNSHDVRVVTYARSSSFNRCDKSIVAQEEAMLKHIEEKGYTLVKTYADEAMTTKANRSQFQQMLKDTSNNKFDVVLVHKLDYLSRDVFELLNFQSNLDEYGVEIETILDSYEEVPEWGLYYM